MAKLCDRRRNKGEAKSRKEAIRNFCLECMGYQRAEVRRCTAKECWLYPWRLGALDDEIAQEKKEVADEKKAKAKEKRDAKKEAKKEATNE